jgi:hypothetical protein
MHLLEYPLAILIILVLLSLAGYFGWRQWHQLRSLRETDDVPAEDRDYLRGQAHRRLLGCALMVLLAGLLAGWYILGPDEQTVRLVQQANQNALNPQQQRMLSRGVTCVTALLLVLVALVAVAAADYVAIRRFGLRHYRRIQADRREMIERELSQLRSDRNGRS